MKGLKCLMTAFLRRTLLPSVFLLSLFSFGFSLLQCSDVSALELEGGGTIAPQVAESYIRRDMGSTKTSPQISGNNIYWQNVPSGSDITQMGIKFSRALPNQGKNSLLVFSIVFQTTHVRNVTYYGFTFRDFTILHDSCLDHGPVLDNNNINNSFTCTFIGLSHAPGQTLLETTELTRLFRMDSLTGQTGSFTMLVSPIYYRQVNIDGLSSSDRIWIQQQLGTSSNQSIIDKLDDILQAIPAGASQADIEEAVKNANDAEKQQTQQDAQDVQSDIENNQDLADIANSTTNFIDILSIFLDAVSNPKKSTNCILPIDLSNYQGASRYDVDLCHLSPPSGITSILDVVFVIFILGLAISAVRMIFSLYKEVINT